MARIEDILNNWKWDEEKIRKYLEEFEKFLKSEKGQNDVKNRSEKLKNAQELLKDEESIESLTSEKLSELLKATEAYRGKRRPASRIEKGDEEYFKEFKAWLKSLIKINPGGQLPEKNPEDIGIAYATELLTLRNPKEFYLINNASIEGINNLARDPKDQKFPPPGIYQDPYFKFYPQFRPLFDYLKEKIKPIIEKNLNREVDYYDVDQFLYFVTEQNGESKKNKTDESQDKNKESFNIAQPVKESDAKNELTLHKFFQYQGFYFDQGLITAFYSALKTKGFVILSGLTGTGKTKLAQLFAEIFEIEKIKEKTDEKYLSFTIEVSPYMLQYNRIHLPKRSYEILNLVNTEKEKYVKVVGGNEEEICKIVKYTADRYLYTLLLKGKVAKWFKDNFKEKEKLQIKVVPTEDNENVILVLKKLEPEKRQIEKKPAYIFLSVKPDWRDSNALLGYYNPITRNYEKTPLLDFILDAINNYNDAINNKKDNAVPFFIILDEMNLSHVEYYFADFLSVLESGRDENYWTKETIKLHNSEEVLLDNNGKEIPKEIKLPPNLYIIGSVNIDETTYMFSPKVLDRAFTIEFKEVNIKKYLEGLEKANDISKDKLEELRNALLKDLLEDLRNGGKFCTAIADKNEVKSAINELSKAIKDELINLNQILEPHDLHFGYRVLDEIALFIKYAIHAPDIVGKLPPEKVLDFAVLMKVLPKFHGPRQKLERPLWLVLGWCLKNSIKYENKTFDNLINEIWGILTDQKKRPSIEDLTNVIQKLKSELDNRSKNESQEANPGSQPIAENQNQAKEESPESTSEPHQTEQTSNDKKTPIINKFKYPRTAIKVLTMLRQLYETGFTSFA